jgi:glycosyltransferase involved in cell wall biosynthesis
MANQHLLTQSVQLRNFLGNNYDSNDFMNEIPEVLMITSFPPRECGIATYSQDLIIALRNKFIDSFNISICALETNTESHCYDEPIKYFLNVNHTNAFERLAKKINADKKINAVLIQHEFGFFNTYELEFQKFLIQVEKPIIIVFHTVLPTPDKGLKSMVLQMAAQVASIIVMTNISAEILNLDYGIEIEKIKVIPHGTHLVSHSDKNILKRKFKLQDKIILSTFGLLSSGKNIETTLDALPEIVKSNSDVLFLIIGKTHPTVLKEEGEHYRNFLVNKVNELGLQRHVLFINSFLPLNELLEYLQLTDIYLFTSKDPNQAVSGTFSYAISCGCPVISTPIPHAKEVLKDDGGIIIDFENSIQLSNAVLNLLNNEELRNSISMNGLHIMASTAWENSAIAHAHLFREILDAHVILKFRLPKINLTHIKKMTTDFGIIQFSKLSHPDIESGYTLDDNARAMHAMCQHFKLTNDESDLENIAIYLHFIKHCIQPKGYFLNYINEQKEFTEQNNITNLADANGRAIWALGYLISLSEIMPNEYIEKAENLLQQSLLNVSKIHSTRAMAFAIKGLCFFNSERPTNENIVLINELANRLVQMYRHEATHDWHWFESYLTYANSILPEAMLCAYKATNTQVFLDIAKASFDFLLFKTFKKNSLKVISNKGWLIKDQIINKKVNGGEQPIDVAYTIIALSNFYLELKDESYLQKMIIAFNWFLGENHLNQIIYNPVTGGCYDGLEEKCVNLNQGAESTISFLMARLIIEDIFVSKSKNQYYEDLQLQHVE